MKKLLILAVLFVFTAGSMFGQVVINLWHAYRDTEREAIEAVAQKFNAAQIKTPDGKLITVKLLMVPFDSINDKLQTTIKAVKQKTDPNLEGPDVFVFAQDFAGDWAEKGLIIPIESYIPADYVAKFFKNTILAFNYMYPEAIWALPGSFKNIALYYNKKYIQNPPTKLSELISVARKFTDTANRRYGFTYETGNFYYHTMWVQAWGGSIFKKIGTTDKGFPIFLPLLYSEPMVKAGDFIYSKLKSGDIIGAAEAEIKQGFLENKVMFAISGQWFRGSIKGTDYGVAQLPIVDEINEQAIPFLTVEGYFLSGCAKDHRAAVEVIKYFTSGAMGRYFGQIGGQTPANKDAYVYSEVANDPISAVFKQAAAFSKPMPQCPEMAITWDPASSGLSSVLNGKDSKTVWREQQARLMKLIEKQRGITFKTYGVNPDALTSLISVD